MDDEKSFRPYLVPTLFLLVFGWAGLFLLMQNTVPALWPRWSFFVLIICASTGTALPLVFLLNRLFPSNPLAAPQVITRQALWIGVYVAVLAWLSVGRILTFSIGLWLALGLAAIEYLLRTRETLPASPQRSASESKDVPPQPPIS
jgi:hypothetical protein